MFQFFSRMVSLTSWKFIGFLWSVYFCLKGFAATLMELTLLPMLKGMGISSSRYQQIRVFIFLPWALKPLFGWLSDAMPIAGYNKRYYIALYGVIGTVCMGILAINMDVGVVSVAVLAFGFSFQVAGTDLLAEGKYAEVMRTEPKLGSSLVSYIWFLMFSSRLGASAIAGFAASAGRLEISVAIVTVLAFQAIFPPLTGCIPEERRQRPVREKPQFILTGIAISVTALGMAALAVGGTWQFQFVYALVALVSLSVISFALLPRRMARMNQYMFLSSVLYVDTSGALDYFYTADESCVPGGPAFDMKYYLTTCTIASAVFGALGIVVFQGCLQNWSFRRLLCITTVLKCLAAMVDFVMIERLNVGKIPDKWLFLGGNAMARSVVAMLDAIPMTVMTAHLCPAGHESLVYALLAGFGNIGISISSIFGVALSKAFHVELSEYACNFEHLGPYVLTAQMGLPLLLVPLTLAWIPTSKINEPLM